MKQLLRFQSEQEFQSFFGQLSSAELPGFFAVEGSGGDKGFDGIYGTIAYQAYYPEDKNRTARNYRNKIDKDLLKILTSKSELGIEITDWVFVVPEDLGIEVVSHLLKKTKETNINCTYWGATKLTELVAKHPHIQDSFPTIFLPPVREGIENIKEQLSDGQRPRVLTSVEIIGDDEFRERKEALIQEYKNKTTSFANAHGDSSAYIVADRHFKDETDRKIKNLQIKKQDSDKAYELELAELLYFYKDQVEKSNESYARRGISGSGMALAAAGKIAGQKQRAIEGLKLKYGRRIDIVEADHI